MTKAKKIRIANGITLFENAISDPRALYGSLVNRENFWVGTHALRGLSYTIIPNSQRGKPDAAKHADEVSDIGVFEELKTHIENLVNHPVNYIQFHKFGPDVIVRPHRDPGGTYVPMLTIGQTRTFRVGGDIDNENMTAQKDRPLDSHHFTDEVVMKTGNLLLFTGSVAHSMVAAPQDTNFDAGGYDWRISILFRWTTRHMRDNGPCGSPVHKAQYKEDVAAWRWARQEERRKAK